MSLIVRCLELRGFRYISGIFPVGVVLHNLAVEYNVAVFSELSLAGKAKQRLVP